MEHATAKCGDQRHFCRPPPNDVQAAVRPDAERACLVRPRRSSVNFTSETERSEETRVARNVAAGWKGTLPYHR